jgi:hypothetical protein
MDSNQFSGQDNSVDGKLAHTAEMGKSTTQLEKRSKNAE